MMAMLRSRTAMFVLVGLTVVGLVTTGAVGLFSALSAPAAPTPPPNGAESAAAPEVPGIGVLGSAPGGHRYTDLGPQCDPATGECVRAVGIAAEGHDGQEAINAVYERLLDNGWGRMLPPGEDDPESVPMQDSALTKDDVIIKGSVEPYDDETVAGLVLADSQGPPPSTAPGG